MKNILSRNVNGQYQRDIGWKRVGPGDYRQHRFYLGRDRAQAHIRALQLEAVWDAVCKAWSRDRRPEEPRPQWRPETLVIAQTVARGETAVRLDHRAGPDDEPDCDVDAVAWVYQLRKDFPMVTIDLEDLAAQQRGAAQLEQAAQQTDEKTIKFLRQVEGAGQTLFQALDAFAEHIKATCLTANKRLSQTGVLRLRQVKQIKEHARDMPLTAFNLQAIDLLLHCWRCRPLSKRTGRSMAVETVRDVLKRIREFLRWLHRNPAFAWRKPVDLEMVPVRIHLTQAELSARRSPLQVKTYTVDQLATLYEVATPTVRLWMLLALNAGFGVAEIASLQVGEVFLDEVHPHFGLSGSFIKRIRPKSRVYGEWKLWDATVAGLKWYKSVRPVSKETTLFLTGSGKPLAAPTKGNNRNLKIQNEWMLLQRKIKEDQPGWPCLSFNKLRKTGSDLVREVADGEVAGVFLCHSQTVRSDDLAGVCMNRNFPKLFKAQDAVAGLLAPMFGKVADPFPADYRPRVARQRGRRYADDATINRIQELRGQGLRLKKIAELVGVPEGRVRWYCQQMNKAK
jgi:hypothetical protein